MQKLSDLIGKKVLSLFDAKEEGTLISCSLSPSLDKITYFELVCEDNDNSLFFPYGAIFNIDECIVIKNSGYLSSRSALSLSSVPCPINLPVYSPYGKSLGFVSDLMINDNTVTAIVVGDNEYAPEKVLRRGEELLIINDSDKKIKLTPVKTREKKPAILTTTTTQSATATAMPTVASSSEEEEIIVPVRLRNPDGESRVGFDFLLGKTVTANIYDGEGVILATEGNTVDEEMLDKVASNGKLVLLALHST